MIEVVAFAAMIALLLAQTIGFGGNLAFWRPDPTATPTSPSIAAQGDDATPSDASSSADSAGAVALERGNPGRTGVYDTTGPEELPALLWRYSDPNGDPQEVLEPIVVGDTIHFSILRGSGYAVSDFSLPDGGGGFGSWLFTSNGRVNIAVGNGLIYAASLHPGELTSSETVAVAALVAYDQETKAVRWRAEIDFASGSSPVLAGDTLVVLAEDALIALDALTGEELWRAPIASYGAYEPQVHRNPAVDGDTVVVNEVVATPGDSVDISGTLRAFDLATGEVRWSIPGEGVFDGPPAIVDGIVYSYVMLDNGCCTQSRLLAVDAMTGAEVWEFPGKEEGDSMISFGSTTSSPVVDAERVYTLEHQTGFESSTDAVATTLVARDRLTGEIAWRQEMGDRFGSQLSVADGVLYYTLNDGGVYAADAGDGSELWRVDTGDGSLGTPIPAEGYLVIASRTAVYAFGPGGDAGEAAADVSGLPPCDAPRTLSETPPTGEPALSLVDLDGNPLGYGVPFGGRMLLADVPTGEPATDAAAVGLYDTLRAMTACARPGSEAELAGFYSDDYFRRFADVEQRPDRTRSTYAELFPVGTIAVGDLAAPFVLPDGRVAMLAFDPLGDRGTLLVFVERDGAWLIDEVVDVGRDAEVWRQG